MNCGEQSRQYCSSDMKVLAMSAPTEVDMRSMWLVFGDEV